MNNTTQTASERTAADIKRATRGELEGYLLSVGHSLDYVTTQSRNDLEAMAAWWMNTPVAT